MESSQELSTEVTFNTVAILKGKGVTAAMKVQQALKNQAYLGVCMSEGVNKKATMELLAESDIKKFYTDVANAKYARPIATLATIADHAAEYMVESGDVPRSEWLRLGEQLKHMETKRGTKARALWVKVQAEADRIFLERKAARLAAPAAV